MKQSEVNELIKGRDRLIEMLILSHLQTLGKVYSLEDKTGMTICKEAILNPFALDEMVDYKRTLEVSEVLNDVYASTGDKILEVMDENRNKQLANMLKHLANALKSKYLKQLDKTEYETKY